MNTDIMTILTERRRHNNYEKIDDICDELTALMGGNLSSTPVFYRDNMIIVRRTFLKSLFWSIKSEKLVRAVIYIVLCMLVLHAPVAVIRESEEKSDDENIKDLLNGFLDGYEYQGIFRETLIKHFGIERNTFTTAISILIRLKVIVQLTDGSYAFAIKPEKDILENKEEIYCNAVILTTGTYLNANILIGSEIVTVFQQADLLTEMKTEDDGNKSDEIVFANEEEAAETVSYVLDNCNIQRWIDELIEVINQHNGDYSDSAVAAKLAEFFNQSPMVSGCGSDFCLIRQEILEYIVLHGYREPLIADLKKDTEYLIPKSAMEILLYMFFVADEEGYLRKTNESGDMLQSKDIANECDISVSAVSKALSCWKVMNIVEKIDENGIKGIKFCNRIIFSIN